MDFVAKWNCVYLFALQQNVIAWRDFSIDSVLSVYCSRDQVQIVFAVIALTWCEEGAVEVVSIVINGSSAAISPC